MQNVVLVIHLLLALSLIGVVLLQRSEGGGLGASSSGPQAGRPALTGLAKLTWGFAIAFITTSIFLTVLAAQSSVGTSVLDRLGVPTPSAMETPALPNIDDLLLPPTTADQPAVPPRADQ
jgi:preprotein translocase subunit SecG